MHKSQPESQEKTKKARRKSDVYLALFWQQWQHRGSRQRGEQKAHEAHFDVLVALQTRHCHAGVDQRCKSPAQAYSLRMLNTSQIFAPLVTYLLNLQIESLLNLIQLTELTTNTAFS